MSGIESLKLKRAGRTFIGDCPSCGYQNGLTVSEKEGRQLYYCHACNDSDGVFQAVRAAGGDNWQPPERQAPERKNNASDFSINLWRQSKPATLNDVGLYLAGRGITVPIPPTIRFNPDMKHTDTDRTFPAMVSAVCVDPFRDCVAVHRTYLSADYTLKAPVEKAKMSLGPLAGGAVRLAPAGEELAVSEGIESGLSFMQLSSIPTWAALSTGGIDALILPDVVRKIIIAADNDTPGLEAANRAAEKWAQQGRTARIVAPPKAGDDWNDYLQTQNKRTHDDCAIQKNGR